MCSPDSAQIFEASHISKWGTPEFKSKPTHLCYAYTTQAAIVEVDPMTGEVNVLKVLAAADVGKIINRSAIEGSDPRWRYDGCRVWRFPSSSLLKMVSILTDSLHKVRLPTADMAPEIIPLIVEVPHPLGPQGAKGFAEAPSLATAPAILNAIYDAVGVRIYDLPADKKRVKEATGKRIALHCLRLEVYG